MLYRVLWRPLLFSLSAETAHRLGLFALRVVAALPGGCALLALLFGRTDPRLRVRAFGRELTSPIGLAAGLDKNAEAFEAFAALGFGFVEVGTLTAQAQPGNPLPRLFRLPADRALINRMGFNNHGAAEAARRLSAAPARRAVLGINIGKTKAVPIEGAAADYAQSAALLAPHCAYMVVNVSSPNTPGLRDLQAIEPLRPLLRAVLNELDVAAARAGSARKPLLLKIAPDLADADVDAVADLALELGLDGIIAVNTTVGRAGLETPETVVSGMGAGGLSGAPLKRRALEVLRRLRARMGRGALLVSVGGIETADEVWGRLAAGANLVQVYTALIYEGPGFVQRLNRALAVRLAAEGHAHVTDLTAGAQSDPG